MKKKDLTDLRNKKTSELEKLLAKKRHELINANAKIKAGQEKNLKKAKNIRRDVAQILTIIREKKLLKEETK